MPLKDLQRKPLGRGLEALFSNSSSVPNFTAEPSSVKNLKSPSAFLPIEQLKPGRHQPRKLFEKETLQTLAQSIKENGLIQPVLVRRLSLNEYEIIAGERRWRAAALAGLQKIPVWFMEKAKAEKNSSVLALVENLQRQDLSPVEIAKAYKDIMTAQGLTQEELAKKIGLPRASIANYLRLLSLPEEVQKFLLERKLSFAVAKILLKQKDPFKQKKWAKLFILKNFSVKQAENFLNQQSRQENKNPSLSHQPAGWQKEVLKKIQTKLGVKTTLSLKKKGGELKLCFYSEEELKHIMDLLLCLEK